MGLDAQRWQCLAGLLKCSETGSGAIFVMRNEGERISRVFQSGLLEEISAVAQHLGTNSRLTTQNAPKPYFEEWGDQ